MLLEYHCFCQMILFNAKVSFMEQRVTPLSCPGCHAPQIVWCGYLFLQTIERQSSPIFERPGLPRDGTFPRFAGHVEYRKYTSVWSYNMQNTMWLRYLLLKIFVYGAGVLGSLLKARLRQSFASRLPVAFLIPNGLLLKSSTIAVTMGISGGNTWSDDVKKELRKLWKSRMILPGSLNLLH